MTQPVADDLRRSLSERDDTGAALTEARIRLRERVAGAADLVGPVMSRPSETLTAQVTAGLLVAEGALQRGDSSRARAVVERASRLAAREGLRWPFQQATPAVKQLIPRHQSDSGDGVSDASASGATRSPERAASSPQHQDHDGTHDSPPPLIDALTAKELEVLSHLSELLTTEEIAAAMFVSVNTVRTHVRSILRKLSVSRRHQAVRRARALDLLGNA